MISDRTLKKMKKMYEVKLQSSKVSGKLGWQTALTKLEKILDDSLGLLFFCSPRHTVHLYLPFFNKLRNSIVIDCIDNCEEIWYLGCLKWSHGGKTPTVHQVPKGWVYQAHPHHGFPMYGTRIRFGLMDFELSRCFSAEIITTNILWESHFPLYFLRLAQPKTNLTREASVVASASNLLLTPFWYQRPNQDSSAPPQRHRGILQ